MPIQRTYWKADGSYEIDAMLGSKHKDVYYKVWGAKHTWLYRDWRGELSQVYYENLPSPIRMAILIMGEEE